MMPKLSIPFLFLLSFYYHAAAQDKVNVKFGDVTGKDFAAKIYPIDSNANAVVIAEVGSSTIEGNSKGWFSVVNKRYKRVHILNKNGFDIADISIALYSSGTGEEEKLDKLRAVTYNLENGKVIETKLEAKANVFEEKLDKNWKIKKFTFPNVKEGSIIELDYSTTSDFIEVPDPWEFQGSYPRLWSEFTFTVPSFFNYVFLKHGYLSFAVESSKEGYSQFNVTIPGGTSASEHLRIPAIVRDHRWVVKNVPALKEENFTSTLKNHIQKIQFQLVEQKDPLAPRRYIESWSQVTQEWMNAEYFGQQLSKENGWISDVTGPLLKGVSGSEEKARKIFAYVRDNITCTDWSRRTMDQTLRNVLKTRKGSVAEINLLLTAMLKHVGIHADPVLLSTRSNGMVYSAYPLMDQYNYVIARALIGNKPYYLDASESHIGFGHLPLRCYNGQGRIVNAAAGIVELYSDSVTERKTTTIFIINDEKGNLVGSLQQTPGYYESLGIRDHVKAKGQEQLQKDIKKAFGADIDISNFVIDSLDKYDYELGIRYDFDIRDEKEDIIYLNPLFGEGYKENPFKSAERFYPVEMPFAMDETVNLQLEVPHGYKVDELPKSLVVKMNEQDDALFEYRISQSGENISLRSRIRFKRAYFLPDEYEALREFFNLIVKKQAEQIVFKKKN